MSWRVVPAAAKRAIFTNETDFQKWFRYFKWNYGFNGHRYGQLYHDQCFTMNPTVAEAIRRLGINEPHEYDQRTMRIMRAHSLMQRNEQLPKEMHTKWEQETWYLQNYFEEIESELQQRYNTGGPPQTYWQSYLNSWKMGHPSSEPKP